MNVKIFVTRYDILAGKPCNPNKCPICSAVSRKLHEGVFVTVEPDEITLYDERDSATNDFEIAKLDDENLTKVQTFIDAYDDRSVVRPFSFRMEIPEWALAPKQKVCHINHNGDTSQILPTTAGGCVQ